MAITYKHHLWNGTDGYLNLPDGVTARVRVKKLEDGDEIKNLDYNLPIANLASMDDITLQTIVDDLIANDEAVDDRLLSESQIVIPAIDPALNTKVKKIKTKTKKVKPA